MPVISASFLNSKRRKQFNDPLQLCLLLSLYHTLTRTLSLTDGAAVWLAMVRRVRETHYWTIKTGHTRRTSYSPYRQLRKPRALFLHPDFNPQTVDNDIALIQLRTPLVLSDYLRPVCLPDVGNFVAIGTRCMVAGWGRVKDSVC